MNSSRARQIRAASKDSEFGAAKQETELAAMGGAGETRLLPASYGWSSRLCLKVCTVDLRPFYDKQCNGPLVLKSICWPKIVGHCCSENLLGVLTVCLALRHDADHAVR